MPESADSDARPVSPGRGHGNTAIGLMIIVASLAFVLAECGCIRARAARYHEIAGLRLRDCVSYHAMANRMKDQGISATIRDRVTRIADHHLSLVEKYSQAARYPWLPVRPDPPEPR